VTTKKEKTQCPRLLFPLPFPPPPPLRHQREGRRKKPARFIFFPFFPFPPTPFLPPPPSPHAIRSDGEREGPRRTLFFSFLFFFFFPQIFPSPPPPARQPRGGNRPGKNRFVSLSFPPLFSFFSPFVFFSPFFLPVSYGEKEEVMDYRAASSRVRDPFFFFLRPFFPPPPLSAGRPMVFGENGTRSGGLLPPFLPLFFSPSLPSGGGPLRE